MEPNPGKLGPYEIRRKIGAGGMGVVYLGWDARLSRPVAIKTLLPSLAQDRTARERFLREARAAAPISHPNVTQIHDIGEADGCVYFAMEYLEGKSVREVLEQRERLPVHTAVSLVRQAAAGLKAAADRGIVHRDVKPSNLFLTAGGTLKITDFGLAKQIIADNRLTAEGHFLGTPNYISPEQASGTKTDLRSDIYSLGVTLYEMLAGAPPFDGDSAVTVVMQHLRAPVPPLRERNPDVPMPLVGLVQRMLSKNPAGRPQDYDDLLRRLERLELKPAGSRKAPVAERTADAPAVPARRPVGFAGRLFAVTLVALLLVVGAGLLLRRGERAATATPGGTTQGGTAEVVPSGQRPSFGVPLPVARESATERAELNIVKTSHEVTADGLLRVFGRVANAGPVSAHTITLQVVLTETDGELLDSIEVPVVPPRLEVGESGDFEAFFPDGDRQVAIMFELNWSS